ncbi:MAG TPA: hypothetical protein VF183_07580, partial [Acidimicrobiales bacterium]
GRVNREDSITADELVVTGTIELSEGCRAAPGGARTYRWSLPIDVDELEELFTAAPRHVYTLDVTGPVANLRVTVTLDHLERPTCRGGFCPSSV